MVRIYIENWAPEYGAPIELDAELPHSEDVDTNVETHDWRPIDGIDDLPEQVAFIDGVRRVDARLTVDDPEAGPVPGICGSCAAGAVIWNRDEPSSAIGETRVERLAIVGEGMAFDLPSPPGLPYACRSLPTRDPAALVQHLQTRMRQVEGELSKDLAEGGAFVISDGPIQPLSPHGVVGYIKRQMAPYLPPHLIPVVAALSAGQRTPLFCFGDRYPRYSWYVRLANLPGGHSWSGIARCECTATLPVSSACELANTVTALLPRFASAPHLDSRAPQNLVPIGALETHLRRLLGDAGLVARALRSAVNAMPTPTTPRPPTNAQREEQQ